MPIQILELIVKVRIDEDSKTVGSNTLMSKKIMMEELTEACTEQVIRRLKQEQER